MKQTLLQYRNILVVAVLALALCLSQKTVESYGDNLQIALPVAAFGCRIATGGGGDYAARFVAMLGTVHLTKWGLGDAPINIRPSGSLHGFPSGHMAAASFGASSLVNTCIQRSPVVKTIVILAAFFVGGSRIESDSHNLWQVLAGALWALLFERSVRTTAGRLRRLARKRKGVRMAAGTSKENTSR
ncbi:phosphatase PAP2 family protein [Martelella lutilitoris]|uniref:Phosphatase PAP2 family protein n=1 Tax=Martelella lutilitoris TaxID=2583532 RepID=A0A5C4JTF7_9HYPH|nr:phosphatase PAP2 family protein [Martelella lutilitoris]TNB48481.1 phosphatase PAP2 family protein [Martelella lutilitoris]